MYKTTSNKSKGYQVGHLMSMMLLAFIFLFSVFLCSRAVVFADSTEKQATAKASSEEVTDFAELATAVGHVNAGITTEIIIANDITVTAPLTFNAGEVTIKGKTGGEELTRSDNTIIMDVSSNANVTVQGLDINGNHTAGRNIYLHGINADLILDRGTVVENAGTIATPTDASIYVDGGNLTLKAGGEITNNVGNYGAVCLRFDATIFKVYGKLTNNINPGRAHNGGAISTWNSTILLYDGCELSGNKSYYGLDSGAGGAVFISDANIYGSSVGKLIMYGGTIKGNEADCNTVVTKKYAKDAGGGGVAVCRGVFIMYGGTITGNKASFGGGVSANNEGSGGDQGGYFIGLGGTIKNNIAWGEETILGDNETVPITTNAANISCQAWGKIVLGSKLNVGDGTLRNVLPFKADIDIDVIKTPAGTNLELRNAHELYVARAKTDEGTELNNAYNALSQPGQPLEGYYQIGFNSIDKTNFRQGRETRWFMGTVSTADFESWVAPTDANVASISASADQSHVTTSHNSAAFLPWSSSTGATTIKVSYPTFTSLKSYEYKVIYIPYDQSDGTAGTPQILTPVEKSDGLYITVNGICRGAFEIEKKAVKATVKFNANGGLGSMANQTVENVIDYDNTRVDPNTVKGESLNENKFTPPSQYYEFAGWSTKPYGLDGIDTTPGAGKDYADKENIIPNAGETVNLYAKWKAKSTPAGDPALVTYYSNDTSVSPVSYDQSVPAGIETKLMSNNFEKKDWEVTSWNTKADGTGKAYAIDAKITLGDKEHLKVYAQWRKNKYPATVVFHGNYSRAEPAIYSQTVKAGTKTTLIAAKYSRIGYTLKSWNTKANGKGKVYSIKGAVTLAEKEKLDLYAQWEKKKSFLLAKVVNKGGQKQKISWTKVKNADGYIVYGSRCNHLKGKKTVICKCKKLKTVKGQSKLYLQRVGLMKNTSYKYYVKAYRVVKEKKVMLCRSYSVHSRVIIATSKETNASRIKASKKSVKLAAGKSLKIKITVTKSKAGKRLLWKNHCAKVRYLSSNKKIATIRKGTIKGRAKGSCKVYAIAPNGLWTTVKVTVR